jgi:ABC-2 type transport system permease protein
VTGALAYLAIHSVKNGIAIRLRRLRQPRYLFIALAVVLYFGTMIFNRSVSGLRWQIPPAYERSATWAAALAAFALLALCWVLAGAGALRFTLADVNFLFPAPIARRQLLEYKLARLLLGVSGSALFITIMIAPLRPVAALLFFTKAWLIMSVIGVHEAGASLYRTNHKESGGLSLRRNFPVLVSIVLLMGASAWVLARFALAGRTDDELGMAAVVALLLIANVVWVLRSDAAFEEEAALTAEKVRASVAAFQKGRARPTARRSAPFRLAATGRPEFAILWKNWLLFGRTPRTWIVAIVLGVLLVGGGFIAAIGSPARRDVVPVLLFVIGGFVVVTGPIMMRWDLRRDLANLVVLKTWPISGAMIIRGELLAPAIALCVGATICTIPACLMAPGWMLPSDSSVIGRLSLALALTVVACAVVLTQLVIQNGIAVSFPAWVRITPAAGTGGVDITGQMLVVMYGGLLLLVLLAVVPASVATLLFFIVGGMLAPAFTFAALLLVECVAATEIVGRILDRTDVQDVSVAE